MEKKSLRDIALEYDQQFKENIKAAKLLVKYLRDPKEQQLATKWLSRVRNIKSSTVEVKKNRNAFLSYLMKVLRKEIRNEYQQTDTGIDQGDMVFQDEYSHSPTRGDENPEQKQDSKFHSKWSEDHRTYVAVQPIPGRGALIYMAVSKHPGIENWDLSSSTVNQT